MHSKILMFHNGLRKFAEHKSEINVKEKRDGVENTRQ